MTLLEEIKRFVARNVASETEYPEEARAEAERLARNTNLTPAEAMVVAGDNADVSDRVIDREIVRSGRSVRDLRRSIRSKQVRMEEDLEAVQNTQEAIEDWTDG